MKGKVTSIAMDDDDWQAEEDLRALIRAEEIKADDKRLKAAMKKRAELKKHISNIEG